MPSWITGTIEDDAGLAGGLGVLDTLRVENGVPLDLDFHLERLDHDCRTVLRCPCPEVRGKVLEVAATAPTGIIARLRTVITAGALATPLSRPTTPNIFISLKPAGTAVTSPTCVIVHDYPRQSGSVLETCKRTDYTRSYAARQIAQDAGYDEAILTNDAGRIACAAMGNIFIREGSLLFTPPLSEGVVAGITRRKLLEKANAREEPISVARLLRAEAVMITSSIAGIREVKTVTDTLSPESRRSAPR